ncbi:dihydroneopterin aldolase [Euzebya tangerina]|uniref:dihydroneopterin aldolase n=1 Tax=Euzebya tangerina TaxID=591198 RepID=UPI000E31932F|nr:dihydroneopterin aldolase [Euzebya tangerina]
MDSIEIRGLRVFAHHGVFREEKRDGQTFVIDVTLTADLAAASTSDDLADTINYGELSHRVADAVRDTQFDLIERLAGHLLDLVMADERVQTAEVRIAKPSAPVGVDLDEVAVRLTRHRP